MDSESYSCLRYHITFNQILERKTADSPMELVGCSSMLCRLLILFGSSMLFVKLTIWVT